MDGSGIQFVEKWYDNLVFRHQYTARAGPFATVETLKFIYVANCSEDNKIGSLISQSGGQFALSGVQFEVNITVLFCECVLESEPFKK